MSVECNICMTDVIYYVLLAECGHIVCENCFIQLKECPFCRGVIQPHVHANLLNSASETQLKKKNCPKCTNTVITIEKPTTTTENQQLSTVENDSDINTLKTMCFIGCCCILIPLSVFYIIYTQV